MARTSFAPLAHETARFNSIGIEAYLNEQLQWQDIEDSQSDIIIETYCPTTLMDDCSLVAQQSGTVAEQLSAAKLLRATYSKRQLYEVMVGFWSDHFNIEQSKNDQLRRLKTKDENDVIRPHALGSFRDMLHASARSPAMLIYLDNWRNWAHGPNENYARELMELHTLGVDGGYTETDVKEVARCLTGWSVSFGQDGWPCSGSADGFVFYPELHDNGQKQVLGSSLTASGIQEGEQLLDRLISHPSTAYHISRKLCRFFLGEDVPNTLVNSTAIAFGTHGDIPAMLRNILLSEAFLTSSDELYRRPLEYGVACLRRMDIRPDEIGILQVGGLLAGTGHIPYSWPDPDGYPLDLEHWLTSTGHLVRWNLAINLAASQGNDGQAMAMRMADSAETAADIVDQLVQTLLQQPIETLQRETLIAYAAAGVGANTTLSANHRVMAVVLVAALLMSSADFQLF